MKKGDILYSLSKLKVTQANEFKAKIPAQFGEDSASDSAGFGFVPGARGVGADPGIHPQP
jgi:hypothetical protein